MKKIILILFALIIAQQTGNAQNVDFSGYVRTYRGMLIGNGSSDLVIMQNTFNLNIENNFGSSAFKVNPLIYNNYSDSLTITLREAYLDLYFDDFDLRIGKQQIVWGKADGVFITDIVSPKDLFEFLLPEFDEIRRGVIGAKFDYYIDNSTFEVVWLPVFTPTVYPNVKSAWAPKLPDFPIQPAFDYSKQTVTPSMENSEIFLKFSSLTELVDFELMGGYMWDDDPTMFTNLTFDPNTMTKKLTITPEHKRLTLAGGSFSTTLGPFVLRGEGAYYWGKYLNTVDPSINNGVIQKDYLHYMFGVDFTLWDINFSAQFIQRKIMNYENIIASNPYFKGENNNMMTYLARYSTLNETLTFELFSYYDFEYSGSLIRPRILYDFSDAINLQFGANIFTGSEGSFGQYDKNDMLYGKVIYSF
jgi:hypothetical protein